MVFIHPWGCSLGERLDRYYLSNTVGNPVETTVALSHIAFSGLSWTATRGCASSPPTAAATCPPTSVAPTTPGGCGPRPAAARNHPAATCAGSGSTPSSTPRPACAHLAEAVGADRLVLGSDYPFDMGVDNPLERLADAGFPPADELAIRGGTAASLFDLPAPVPTRGARS